MIAIWDTCIPPVETSSTVLILRNVTCSIICVCLVDVRTDREGSSVSAILVSS